MNDSKKENRKFQEFKLINWKSIAIGIIITLTGFIIAIGGSILRLDSNLELLYLLLAILILAPVIGGFATAHTNKPAYKVGVINGAFAALIGLIIFMLSNLLIGILWGAQFNIVYFTTFTALYSIPVTLLGILGTYWNQHQKIKDKKQKFEKCYNGN